MTDCPRDLLRCAHKFVRANRFAAEVAPRLDNDRRAELSNEVQERTRGRAALLKSATQEQIAGPKRTIE
jgi:hypothetical protein